MKIPAQLEETLNATGIPWTLEQGGKHQKVKLGGRLVAIVPNGREQTTHKRSLLNAVTQVRRMARELKSQ